MALDEEQITKLAKDEVMSAVDAAQSVTHEMNESIKMRKRLLLQRLDEELNESDLPDTEKAAVEAVNSSLSRCF